MHETSARGWCTGMTQRVGMGGRWEGRSGWGTHVNSWLLHVNVWQKPLQYCKVINLQLIEINGGVEGEEDKRKKKICKRTSIPSCFLPCEDTRNQWSVTGRVAKRAVSPELDHAGTLTSDFQTLELWEINFCCL